MRRGRRVTVHAVTGDVTAELVGGRLPPDEAEEYVRLLFGHLRPWRDDWPGPHGELLTYEAWLDWVAAEAREPWSLAYDLIRGQRGAHVAEVSTSFIPDLAMMARSVQRPDLWETMIFGGGPLDLAQWRWPTRVAALSGHQAIVREVRAVLGGRAHRARQQQIRSGLARRGRRAARRQRLTLERALASPSRSGEGLLAGVVPAPSWEEFEAASALAARDAETSG